MQERFRATYLIETGAELQRAAAAIAGEQSSGTFLRIPGETRHLVERHGATVESLEELDPVSGPSLPGARPSSGGGYKRARVTISWPLENIGFSVSNLMATVLGNLSELKELSGIRLTRIELPDSFVEAAPRPAFGIAGTRRLTGVFDRPLIGTIIKPSVGLSPEETADLVSVLLEGGLDFVKDDELIADPPYSPLERRVPAVMDRINGNADRTGRKMMYAFNITGTVDEMRRRHDLVLQHGGTSVMVSLNWIGLAGLEALRRDCQLPIHGHRNGWGIFSRAPMLGLDFAVYQVLWRLLGADHIHVNGLRNKFSESDTSVIASGRACLSPLVAGSTVDDRIMPVFSSAQTAVQVADTYKAVNSVDLIYACGGGIMGHPLGVAAGSASIRQAWDAAIEGVPLQTYGQSHPELASALEAFADRSTGAIQ